MVVEHEEAVIRSADNLIEIGPGRGELGGKLVYHGPVDQIEEALPESLTAAYLTGEKTDQSPRRGAGSRKAISKYSVLGNITSRTSMSAFLSTPFVA